MTFLMILFLIAAATVLDASFPAVLECFIATGLWVLLAALGITRTFWTELGTEGMVAARRIWTLALAKFNAFRTQPD